MSQKDEDIQTIPHLKTRLQEMDNYEFEHLVADLWERMGWNTEVLQASVDAGIDVIATKETPYPQKKVIQAKRYSSGNTVGGPDIQQYASLKHQEPDADSVIVVTTSSFTTHAHDRAKDLNVKLVDVDALVSMINEVGIDVVRKYIDLTSEKESKSTESASVPDTESGVEEVKTERTPIVEEVKTERTPIYERLPALFWVSVIAVGTVDYAVLAFTRLLASWTSLQPGDIPTVISLPSIIGFVISIAVVPYAVYADNQYIGMQGRRKVAAAVLVVIPVLFVISVFVTSGSSIISDVLALTMPVAGAAYLYYRRA